MTHRLSPFTRIRSAGGMFHESIGSGAWYLLFPHGATLTVLAGMRIFVKEYAYQASELDSKASCRATALEQVKREILEELGTYVESTAVVQDFAIHRPRPNQID